MKAPGSGKVSSRVAPEGAQASCRLKGDLWRGSLDFCEQLLF